MQFKRWVESDDNIQTWLGRSVIRSIVYHGTNKKFNKFSYQKSKRYVLWSEFDVEAKGFFFAENPHDALTFGSNVAACYVKMTNPLLDPRRDKHLGVDKLDNAKEMHLLKILGPMIQREDGNPYIDIGVRRVYIKSHRYQHPQEWIYEVVSGDGLNWDCLDNPGVISRMQSLGYDGTFVAEPESWIGRSIFVISPDQVKIDLWTSGLQSHWGSIDDYGTKKTDGLNNFYGPSMD
jgi:hypothetical protein